MPRRRRDCCRFGRWSPMRDSRRRLARASLYPPTGWRSPTTTWFRMPYSSRKPTGSNMRRPTAAAESSAWWASTCQTTSRSFALPSMMLHFSPSTAPRWKARLSKGERLYSMGNPLDLGFTIIEGTYNGLVDRTYNDRVHFSGALNPGMSGGPTVTAEGQVVGVNVATRRGGQLLSFLVPARYAAALLQRVREQKSPPDLRAEVGRQFAAWRSALYRSFAEKGFRRPRSGRIWPPRRWRPGSIAGRIPMRAPRRGRASASIRSIARPIPACSSPPT